jgi:uncharacterized protein YlbG (UPF0298 family)
MGWITTVCEVENEGLLVYLNCRDTKGEDEVLTFSKHTFDILEKYGAVHFTSKSGGYVHCYIAGYEYADEKIKANVLNNAKYGYDDIRKYIK